MTGGLLRVARNDIKNYSIIKQLNVIQLIDSLQAGGAEMMAVNIANGLAELGVVSHIGVTRKEGDLKEKIAPNVSYVFLNKKYTLDIVALKKLIAYVKKHQINLIHAHSSSYFMAYLVTLFCPNVRLIWHNHYGNTINLSFFKKTSIILLSNFFFTTISVNKSLHLWALKNSYSIQKYYLPNFAALKVSKIIENNLFGEEEKRIVCLANLRPEKDHLNLLKAFIKIKQQYPDWSLHLVGKDFNDAYAYQINSFIVANDLNNHVFLYGSIKNVAEVLQQAAIGVLASNSEGLPVALLEYGLAKLPVVVTNVGECSSVVKHQQCGLVVPAENSNELVNALQFLIENAHKRDAWGVALQQRIQQNYSQEVYMNKLVEIYKDES
ncbi:glycosyltransferase [uncultured Lutibacter sp.]|uniref:glycosyltransferase n=1 Tax=uncultured Lutibacter sp. TaxID=437739 RepID=UPI00260945EC|nr:glycosyltransferase [uncultured Lutibacter sp.]